MVEHLQACLAAGAQLSLIDGILRIAFEFFRQAHLNQPLLTMTHDFCLALHNPHLQPAARGAKSAHARLQGGNAGDQLFLGNETDQLLIRRTTGFERCHHARESRYLDEVSPFHKSQ